MENCTFGEHPVVLVKLKLLANIAIYWPIPNLANKSEQIELDSHILVSLRYSFSPI